MLKKAFQYLVVAILSLFVSLGVCTLIFLPKLQNAAPEPTSPAVLQTTPPETTAETETQPYDFIDELIAIAKWEPEKVQQTISTWEDAVTYFDRRYPTLSTETILDPHVEDDKSFLLISGGQSSIARGSYEFVPRFEVVQGMNYLLSDDLEIYTVLALCSDNGDCPFTKVTNCIKTEDGYDFRDPVGEMAADEDSRTGRMLPDAKVQSFEEYFALLSAIPELRECIDRLYIMDDCELLNVRNDYGVGTITSPEVEPLWGREVAGTIQQPSETDDDRIKAISKTAHQNLWKFDRYKISSVLGGATLTPEEAIELVDATPEEAKEKIKTAPDLLMYMLAANLQDSGGDIKNNWGGYTWATNMSAKEVMETRLGNCGACANLANYMLEGDYEEVGFIDHTYNPGGGGGHVYNYFLYEGKYYVVDFSSYLFSKYSLEYDYGIFAAESLEYWPSYTYKYHIDDVCLITAYTSPGRHYPSIYYESGNQYYLYIPEQAECTILFQSDSGYQLARLPFDISNYDWTKFWED